MASVNSALGGAPDLADLHITNAPSAAHAEGGKHVGAADTTSSALAPIPTARRRQVETARRELLLRGTDPLASRDNGPLPKVVVGVSDQGIGLAGGQLYAWSAQDRDWKATGATGVANLKLGANNDQVWALHDDGALRRLDADGVPQHEGQFQLPAGVVDFAVSPTAASVSFITSAGLLQRQHAAGGPAERLLPPEGFEGAPASLAQTNNGDLYVASSQGQVWVKPARPAAGSGEGWSRVGYVSGGKGDKDGKANVAPGRLGNLQVLRDGSLGAQETNGALCKYDRLKNAWTGTTLHASSAHRRAFEGQAAGWGWNHIRLNGAPRAYSQLGLPASTPSVAGHGDFEAVKDTLRRSMDQLSLKSTHATPALSTLPREVQDAVATALDGADGVDAAAGRVLDTLEHMDREKKLPRSRDATEVNSPDKNALRAVYNFRTRVLNRTRGSTPPDPVTQRLGDLLNDRVYLPINDSRTMIAMGRMVVDHALVKAAIDQHAGVAPTIGTEEAADVAALFDAGMVDADAFKRINALSANLNAGMSSMSPGVVRAAGPVEGKDAQAIGAQFAELVSNLRPGKESIVLNFSHSKGVDLEGLWMFFNQNSDTFGKAGKTVLSANTLPILTPLGTGSHGGTLTIETSRTETGVQVVLSDASATSVSAGVRAQMRFGGVWQKAKGAVTLLAVTGAEGALIPGVAVSSERSVAMQFNQDDHGKVQQVIADLYSGEVRLTDLLKNADLITNSKGDSYNVNTEGYVHVFAALRSIYGKAPEDPKKPQWSASNLLVPALDQVSVKGNYGSATQVSRDQDGNTTHQRKSGVTGSADFNHISVVDISTWFSIPYGKDGSTQIQWKVPALLSVLNHNLWTNKIEPQDVTVELGADGALAGASVTMATNDAFLRSKSADRPLTQALFPQLAALVAAQPRVQPFLDTLNASPSLRPAVTLELTPAALAQVHQDVAALAAAGATPEERSARFVALVNKAMSKPDKLRIARIDVGATQSVPEQSILAFGPLRAVRAQSHTFAAAGSSLSVQYDPDTGAATGFKVEGRALLGDAVRPDIGALAALG